MGALTGWLSKNVGNSSVSYGTVMLLVLVVVATMVVYNMAFATIRKVA